MLLCTIAHAEERAITVAGNGEVKARPNRLEIDVQAAGAAELTSDAILKYDDSLRRITEAFEKLGIERLAVEQGDLVFASTVANQNARVIGVAARGQARKAHVAVGRSLQLKLRDIDQMPEKELIDTIGKILDTAQDAGATLGMSAVRNMAMNQFGNIIVHNQNAQPVVAFYINDPQAMHDRAYERAFEDATSRGEKLARLAGAKLGPVLSIDEIGTPQNNPYAMQQPYGMQQQSLASVKLAEIPVHVSLRVRFALEELKP
ncbi:MAG TPA: SIMPL domain-containing protein [Pirellulales bacterium]